MSLLWRMAVRGLLRHGRRNFVTALAIALGFSGLALMGAYIIRVDNYLGTNTIYSNYIGHLAVFAPGASERNISRNEDDTLSKATQETLLRIAAEFPEIEFTAKVLRGSGLLATGCRSMPFVAIGIERAKLAAIERHAEILRWTPELARPKKGARISDSEVTIADPISLTPLLALALGKPSVLTESGGKIAPPADDCEAPGVKGEIASSADLQLVARSFSGDFSAVDSQIIGHHTTGMAFTEETSVTAPLELLQNLYGTDTITYLSIYLKPPADTRGLLARLRSRFENAGLKVEVFPFYDERVGAFYQGVMRFLFTMALFFLILVIAMIAVTIVNFVTVGLLERMREIGTLRAIGFDVSKARSLFLREAFLLTVAGLVLGLGISALVEALVGEAGIRFSPPGIAGDMPFLLLLTPSLCLGVAFFIGSVAMASAVWRLRSLGKSTVVDLLNG